MATVTERLPVLVTNGPPGRDGAREERLQAVARQPIRRSVVMLEGNGAIGEYDEAIVWNGR